MKRKRTPQGKKSCEGSGALLDRAPLFPSAGSTVRRLCPGCGEQIRAERVSPYPQPQRASYRFIKHTRPLSEDEFAERKAAVKVSALKPRGRPSGLASRS